MGINPEKSAPVIIAIDGPAGSGKSTVSKRIAKSLGIVYIDTGAMYRALTLKAVRKDVALENVETLIDLARNTKVDLEDNGGILKVLLDGEDVSAIIRTPELTNKVVHIARVPGVRGEMVRLQRMIGEKAGGVMEGRDIGTVVFPDADYKFYLDADPRERARRRYDELVALGQKVELAQIEKDVIKRDESDMNRSVGALRKAEDAIFVDTTKLTIDGVVEKVLSYIKRVKA